MFHKELQLEYNHIGEHESCLLLFHAFPLNQRMYQLVDFAELDHFSIVTFDLPGFGGSPSVDQEFSIKDYAEMGRDLMNDLGYTKYYVGGTSMGGYITLAFEKYFSAKSKGIILIDTKDMPDSERVKKERYEVIDRIKHGMKYEYIKNLLPKLLFKGNLLNTSLVDFIKEMMLEAEDNAIIQALIAMANREDSRSVITNITKPGILIFGEYDALTTLTFAKEMHARNENLHFSLIPGAGHLAPVEKPYIFYQILSSFFRYVHAIGDVH